MGVGSEVYGAVQNGRRAIGIELKTSYYTQAVKNVKAAKSIGIDDTGQELLGLDHEEQLDTVLMR